MSKTILLNQSDWHFTKEDPGIPTAVMQRLYEPCACVGIEGNPRTLRGRHCRNQRG